MRVYRRLLLVALVAIVFARDVEAQVIQRPPRVYRGLFGASTNDPTRWRQDVALAGNALGGLDDNLSPTAGAGQTPSGNEEGTRGYTGFVGLQLQYSLARGAKTVDATAQGFQNSFQGIGVRPVYGGEGSLRLATDLGGRMVFALQERYRDDPLFAPSVVGPRPPIADPTSAPEPSPIVNSTQGYLVRRTQALESNLSLQRRWTRNNSTSGAIFHGATRYADGQGDSDSVGGSLNYQRILTRASGLNTAYSFSSFETREPDGAVRPLKNHSLTVGYALNHQLSPSRQVSVTLSGGATQVETFSSVSGDPLTYRTPAGNAGFRIDLTRSWTFSTDYGRSVSVIQGVTLDSFITENVTMRAGGALGSRGDLAVSANWVTGLAGGDGAGTYDSYTAIAQMQAVVNRWMNAMISYTFYAYRLSNVTVVTEGVASSLDRNAVRVGVTFRLPLIGTYTATTPSGGGN